MMRLIMNHSSPKISWFEHIGSLLMRQPEDREQLVALLHSAYERNLLDADALTMIEGVMHVSEMQVRDIMIPRSHMDTIDISEKPAEFIPFVIEKGHSRFPVTDGSKDQIIGILLAKDLLRYYSEQESFNVREMLRPMLREWLDANLPQVVESLVAKEIARITGNSLG